MQRIFTQVNNLKSWLFVLAILVFVVVGGSSPVDTLAAPLIRANPINAFDARPPVVLNGTSNSVIYLPAIWREFPPPAVYWGALVDRQAPSTENMRPGGVFDQFETRVQKRRAI